MTAHDELRQADRVRAVRFWLDEGLRIWPIPGTQLWRVVSVRDQQFEPIGPERAALHDLQGKFPDATPGINDNETVPPGTEGTVESAGTQVWVRWDNGARLALTDNDEVERI